MNVIFDQGTPVPLRRYLRPHRGDTVFECGWSKLKNGDLVRQIATARYNVLVTTDQSLRHQQEISSLPLGVIILTSTSWPKIEPKVHDIQHAATTIEPGKFSIVEI